MDMIHRLAGNFMLGFFILLSYRKIIRIEPKRSWHLFYLTLSFAIYMFFTYTYVQEPFRTVSGTLILGCLTWWYQRLINWAALTLALLMGYFAWIISVLATAILVAPFRQFPSQVYWALLLLMQAGIYLACYQVFRLKSSFPPIDEFEIKVIVFAVATMVLTFFGGYHVTLQQLHEYNLPLFRAAFAALISVTLAAIFLIVLFSKRYHERMEAEKYRLALEKDNGELSTKHHRVRELIQNIGELHAALIDEVKIVTNQNNIEKLPLVRRCLDIARQTGAELSEEFALDDFIKEFRGFVLPENWLSLKQLVVKAIRACEQKEFSAFAKNTATTWEQIEIPKIMLNRLVGNLLRNAINELDKTNTDNKAMEIYFFNDDNHAFTIEVHDTAHEFPVQVLANLGKRGNSTNGTGNGYAEIFEFLAETGASLTIIEQMKSGNPAKIIRVAFDYQERIVIRSSYRYAILKEALTDSRLEVELLI